MLCQRLCHPLPRLSHRIETLNLEKYIDEITSAVPEGIALCKLEKDVWSAAEVCRTYAYFKSFLPSSDVFQPSLHPHSSLHSVARLRHRTRQRLPTLLQSSETRKSPGHAAATGPSRLCVALVGVIRDAPGRSGGEWVTKALRDLVCFLLVVKRVFVLIRTCLPCCGLETNIGHCRAWHTFL